MFKWFEGKDKPTDKVYNPLKVVKSSIIEFNIGELKNSGMFRFKKIIEFNFGNVQSSRYVIYSKVDDSEYIFEVFPIENGQFEAYLYNMIDTVPFSEDFLEVVGQLYLTTPDDIEYRRSTLPDCEDRLDGTYGSAKVYDIESDQIEKVVDVTTWDYERDCEGIMEYLNIEMWKENGMFRIFRGEMLEDIFFKFYQSSED